MDDGRSSALSRCRTGAPIPSTRLVTTEPRLMIGFSFWKFAETNHKPQPCLVAQRIAQMIATVPNAWLSVVMISLLSVGPLEAAEWYAGPQGNAAGKGNRETPWDLESTLAGRHPI